MILFSVSERQDNLAHWDRYADSRRGVCIGIDISKLSKIPFIAMSFVQIYPIIYNEEQRRKYLLQSLKEKIFNSLRVRIVPKIPDDLFYKKMGYILISDCYRQMKYFVKKDVWQDEGKIRIAYEDTLTKDTFSKIPHLQEVYKGFQFPDMNSIFKQSGLNILKFELINNKIRPCRFLDISSIWNTRFVKEVILGTKCEQSKKDLELFLTCHELKDVSVTESRIKIR